MLRLPSSPVSSYIWRASSTCRGPSSGFWPPARRARPPARPATRERGPVGIGGAAPAEVREQHVDVVAARLGAMAVGEQHVLAGVDLAGDERERVLRQRREVLRYESQEPDR